MKSIGVHAGIMAGLLLGSVTATAAANYPLLVPEDYQSLSDIADSRWNSRLDEVPYFFGADGRSVFVPYDQVRLSYSDDGTPIFGMAYDVTGARLNIGVEAAYTEKTQDAIRFLRAEGYIVHRMPIYSGGWSLILPGADQEQGNIKLAMFDYRSRDLEVKTIESTYTNTVFPENTMILSADLGQSELARVINGLRTGAGVSVAYHYFFPAQVENYSFNAEIDWTAFTSIVQSADLNYEEECERDSSGFNIPLIHVGGSSSECNVDYEDIRRLVRTMITDGDIRIRSTAAVGFEREVEALTNLVIAAKFEPEPSLFKPVNPQNKPVSCNAQGVVNGIMHGLSTLAPGIGAYNSTCKTASHSYYLNSYQDFQAYRLSYDIQSNGIQMFPATISGAINNLCDRHPEMFRHMATGIAGCPTQIFMNPNTGQFVIGVDADNRQVTDWSPGDQGFQDEHSPAGPSTPNTGLPRGELGIPRT